MVIKQKTTDYQIIQALQNNCRISNADIARKLGVTRQTVTSRISLLQRRGIICGYRAVIDPRAMGYEIICIMGVSIDLAKAKQLMKSFLAMKEIFSVAMITGTADLYIIAIFPDTNAVERFITEKISTIKAVRSTNTQMVLREYWRPNPRSKIIESPLIKKPTINKTDRKILEILQLEARLPIVGIARKTGLSEQTISKRLRTLESKGVIRFYQVDLNYAALGLHIYAHIEVNLNTRQIDKVIRAIMKNRNISILSETTGQYDLHFSIALPDMNSLRSFLQQELRTIPEISDFKTNIVLKEINKYWI